MKGFFVTGTGTEVGKTWFTALLVRTLRGQGIPALGLKPVAAGDRVDAEILAKANDEQLSLNEINPLFLSAPLAPYTVSLLENRPLDWREVDRRLEGLAARFPGPFIVEGVGGWLVPITRDYWVRDWARQLGMPVVIVATAGLGAINHTLLTVESVRRTGLPIAGIVMNLHGVEESPASQTNPAIVEELAGLPVLVLDSGQSALTLPPWLDLESGCFTRRWEC